MLQSVLWGGSQLEVDHILSCEILHHLLRYSGDGGVICGAPAVCIGMEREAGLWDMVQ